jgi:hypothetical protein
VSSALLPSATMSSPSVLDDTNAQIHASDSELGFKRAQNALRPICRLPPEIVAAIITHVQHRSWSFDDLFVQFNHSWVRITLVCRYFREVVVQTPALWTVVNYWEGSERWRNLCIERSQTAPLCVYSRTPLPPDQWKKAQIAHLVLHGHGAENVFRYPAPLLQELKIGGPFIISTALLHSVATSLHHLHLFDTQTCLLIDGTLSLPSLRHLRLSSFGLDYRLHRLVPLLQSAPMLDTLFVERVYVLNVLQFVDADVTIPISQPVTMPNIRLLYIENPPAEAWALMRLIKAPLATLRVKILNVGVRPHNQWTSQGRIVEHWQKFNRRGTSPASDTEYFAGSIRFHRFEGRLNFGMITFTYSLDTISGSDNIILYHQLALGRPSSPPQLGWDSALRSRKAHPTRILGISTLD